MNAWTETDIIGIDIADIDLIGALRFIDKMVEDYGVRDYCANPSGKLSEMMACQYQLNGYVDWDIYWSPNVCLYNNVQALYPMYLGIGGYHAITIPTSIKLSVLHNGVEVESFETQSTGSPKVYKYTPTTVLPNVTITIKSTASIKRGQLTQYAWDGSFLPASWMQGIIETSAEFGSMARNGGLKIIRLGSNTPPIAVQPGDYNECWWDEFEVDPIGTVTITYVEKDENGNDKENVTDVSIGNGQSRYDMSNNETLKSLPSMTLEIVTGLINTSFAPYAKTVSFTPIELSMQGWPWLEAGDALEIEAEDGTMVETYALRVEMSGIQNLQAVITAEGGEIIEEVE